MKKTPIDSNKLKKMQSPQNREIYDELLDKYGEDIIHNNIETEFILLTEGENIIADGGTMITLTADETDWSANPPKISIREVYEATRAHWIDYLLHPVNAAKSWFNKSGEGIGIVPIITNHKILAENQHGFILGNSLHLSTYRGKMVLKGKGLLISPRSKWEHTAGNWLKVSPTFANSTLRIKELSYVAIPAQETNTSLNSGDTPNAEYIYPVTTDNQHIKNTKTHDINKLYAAALDKQFAKVKKQEELQQKSANKQKCKYIAEDLFRRGLIASSQLRSMQDGLISLSSGDFQNGATKLVKNMVSGSRSPFNTKPKTLMLKGNPHMNKTDDQLYVEFYKANHQSYNDDVSVRVAADLYIKDVRKQQEISLSGGDVLDPKANLIAAMELAKKANVLEDDSILSALKEHGISLSSGDGATQSAGTVEQPNNTQLNSDDAKNMDGKKCGKSKKKLKTMLEYGAEKWAMKEAKKAKKAAKKSVIDAKKPNEDTDKKPEAAVAPKGEPEMTSKEPETKPDTTPDTPKE